MEIDTADVIARARSGDHDAFNDLVQGYWYELQVHCYRILGSLQDAEDALQETLVSAGEASGSSASARRSAPGSTRSRPTGAWTCCAPTADVPHRSDAA